MPHKREFCAFTLNATCLSFILISYRVCLYALEDRTGLPAARTDEIFRDLLLSEPFIAMIYIFDPLSSCPAS